MSDEILRVLDALADEKGEGRVRRARAELEQKDAVIKALADALWGDGHVGESGKFHVGTCRTFGHSEECDKADAALRLAGRL